MKPIKVTIWNEFTHEKTNEAVKAKYPAVNCPISKDVFFITTQELEDMYPDKDHKERERLIAKEKGAVCLMKIGDCSL